MKPEKVQPSYSEREIKAMQLSERRQSNGHEKKAPSATVALLKATPEAVTFNVPALVQAQSVQNLEISRLTKDPMFGDVNKGKILNADKIIRDSRINE